MVMPCTRPSLARPKSNGSAGVGRHVAVAGGVDEDPSAHRLAPGLGVHQHGAHAAVLDDRLDGREVAEHAHAGVPGASGRTRRASRRDRTRASRAAWGSRAMRCTNRPPRSIASCTKPKMTCFVRSLVCQMLTRALVAMPPRLGQRSSRTTFAPCRAAQQAAEMPAVPPPQTTTSASASTGTLRSGMTSSPESSRRLSRVNRQAGSRRCGTQTAPSSAEQEVASCCFHADRSLNKPGYSVHGLRPGGRVSILLASSSPTNRSLSGSNFSLRPSWIAIWPRWPSAAVRCPTSASSSV